MAAHKSTLMHTPAPCSICLEAVINTNERSIVKLTCGHYFHLDCIGSAFNAKGAMQCPNCRHVENGRWLYANGCMQREWFTMEDVVNEEEHELSRIILPFGLFFRLYGEWCPYRPSAAEVSFRGTGSTSTDISASTRDYRRSDYVQSCPFLQAQGRNVLEQHVESLEMMHERDGLPEQFRPLRAQRISSTVAPTWSIWSTDPLTMRDPMYAHRRNSRRLPPIVRRRASHGEQYSLSGPSHAGTSIHDTAMEVEPWMDATFSESSASVSRRSAPHTAHRQYSTEPEVQWWAPSQLSGSHSLHGLQTCVPTHRPSDAEIRNWSRTRF